MTSGPPTFCKGHRVQSWRTWLFAITLGYMCVESLLCFPHASLWVCISRSRGKSVPGSLIQASWDLLEPPGLSQRSDWGTIGGCACFGLNRDYF